MWRRCRRIARSLPLSAPFDPASLVRVVAKQRGRRIEVLPLPIPPSAPCGLLASTDSTDYIFYTTGTTPLHQQHILLHEVAHLLCRHDGDAAVDPAAARFLTPHLPPALTRRVLGRTAYSEPQEQEAEILASLMLHRLACEAGAPPASAVDVRLGAVFGAPPGAAPHG